jgi:hypothetical protein
MSWLITGTQKTLNGTLTLGQSVGGGFFAGYISHTADGNPTHALIVAPRDTGATGSSYTLTTNQNWAPFSNAPDGVNYGLTLLGGTVTGSITGTTMTVESVSSGKVRPGHTITGTSVALGTTVINQTSGTTNGAGNYTVSVSQEVTSQTLTARTSVFDGFANGTLFKDIDSTVGSGSTIFPAANFCEALSIGGYTDWYLPSRLELDIAYFNLKPSTDANVTSTGTNIYAVPRRNSNFTVANPIQTSLAEWQSTGGSQSFASVNHWSSTESDAGNAWYYRFSTALEVASAKPNSQHVRAFRRIAL